MLVDADGESLTVDLSWLPPLMFAATWLRKMVITGRGSITLGYGCIIALLLHHRLTAAERRTALVLLCSHGGSHPWKGSHRFDAYQDRYRDVKISHFSGKNLAFEVSNWYACGSVYPWLWKHPIAMTWIVQLLGCSPTLPWMLGSLTQLAMSTDIASRTQLWLFPSISWSSRSGPLALPGTKNQELNDHPQIQSNLQWSWG